MSGPPTPTAVGASTPTGDGPPTGVLVMAHGTPGSPEEIEAFYTSIRRGRPPTPELLAELESRYQAIGGLSPLAAVTRSQVAALRAELDRGWPGRFVVGYGAKHLEPSIERGMEELVEAGARRVVGIVLTPHESSLGSGSYLERARAAAAGRSDPAIELVAVRSWHRTEGFAELLAERTEEALQSIGARSRTSARVHLFFTAHSLPEDPGGDDTYPRQVAETAEDVAGLLGLAARPEVEWSVAWQSAGKAPGRWLGPDLLSEVRRAAMEGVAGVAVCPAGFVADHLEVLYDLDVEAAGEAGSLGLAFARTRSLNDDPRLAAVLARAVVAAAAGTGGTGAREAAEHSEGGAERSVPESSVDASADPSPGPAVVPSGSLRRGGPGIDGSGTDA
ncbi:MAG TPA: ferrochelatase [Acidimicrobiales bacterium]|nr:ferrochelatase [Acidimicrobiales bacterium]